jgi:endoglucanase
MPLWLHAGSLTFMEIIAPSQINQMLDGPLIFRDPAQRVISGSGNAPPWDVTPGRRLTAMSRRALVGAIAVCGRVSISRGQSVRFSDEWRAFKSRFLSADGRIVDNANGGVSHSEGQGWGLLFAAAAQDQAGFDLILNWTSRTMRRPTDALHAWRYVPNDTPPVRDLNNAVDGDMFIATALVRAGRSWGRPDHLQAAAAIGRDILRLLLRQAGSFTVLLPGIEGFESADAIIVNPSYYAFPMVAELAKLVPSPKWDKVQEDGRLLLEQGRFGQWSLPPDWLRIGKADSVLSPAPGWPPRFSYDAIRVPLWWIWQKLPVGPAMRSIERFWAASPRGAVPAWVDLKTNEVATYVASPGVVAIMRLMRLSSGQADEVSPQTIANTASYYDASLILLAHIAEQEMQSH